MGEKADDSRLGLRQRHVLDKEIWSLRSQLQTARLSFFGGIRFDLFSSCCRIPMWIEHDVNAQLLGIDIVENSAYYLIILLILTS